MRALLAAMLLFVVAVAASVSGRAMPEQTGDQTFPSTLSQFGFFNGSANKPAADLIGYRLRTPLFSDYAEKMRFIRLPKGATLHADVEGHIQFPIGTALIKSFGYPDAKGEFRMIETRVLLRRTEGWLALPYVWRADGQDADLKLAGARIPVDTVLPGGRKIKISYAVPNKNQCKTCHGEGGQVVPIGPRVGNIEIASRQYQRQFAVRASQSDALDWRSVKPATLESRARSYLAINCAHCHGPNGSASNSGLFLGREISDQLQLGIGKRPVAAGRGAGDFEFVIDPGHPERSIMIHRMKSIDPGIAMPELGRAAVHDEGVKLLEEWIRVMKPRSN